MKSLRDLTMSSDIEPGAWTDGGHTTSAGRHQQTQQQPATSRQADTSSDQQTLCLTLSSPQFVEPKQSVL